jgi:hypothetical protein
MAQTGEEIAGIAVIARHRRHRKNKTLPQINADKRGSGKIGKTKTLKHGGKEEAEEIGTSGNRDIGESGNRGIGKQKPTAEARRCGENRKQKIATTEGAEEHGEVNSRGLPISAIFGNSGDSGNSTDPAACIEIRRSRHEENRRRS